MYSETNTVLRQHFTHFYKPFIAKYGHKEGAGLGKMGQGMATPLEVEKTSRRGGKIVAGQPSTGYSNFASAGTTGR